MKRVLRIVGGLVAVLTLACLLTTPVQARSFVSVNVGFGGYGGYGHGGYYSYCGPAYYSGYCYPALVYYRPVYRYCYPAPVYYYGGGYRCWR